MKRNAVNSLVFTSFDPGTVEAGKPIASEPDANGVRHITYPFTIKPNEGAPPFEFSITANDAREWTQTPPTEAGSYWLRREGEESAAIVEVTFEDRKQGFGPQMIVQHGESFLALEGSAIEWARS